MSRQLFVDNYLIDKPMLDILTQLKLELTNGKLKDISIKNSAADNILVTCPHHNNGLEKNPDANIYIGDNENIQYGFVHCFACGFKSDFIGFVAECFDRSTEFAKHWLITNFGVLAYHKINLGKDIKISKTTVKKASSVTLTLPEDTVDWCPYFEKRGLTYETCKKFNLRYDTKYRHVIFPCYDKVGKLVMLPWRAIDSKQFYLDKNIAKPLYGIDQVYKNNLRKVLITEGPFDRLLAEQYGFPAVATLGSISDEQIAQLNKSSITVLYTMFDRDSAGCAFTKKIQSSIAKRILVTNIEIPAPYKDIGELSYDKFWEILKKYIDI